MRRKQLQEAALVNQTRFKVRFSEVDAMQVVWHGEYVRYMEDGRESFGREYGLGYLDISAAGYIVPIVEINVQYKQSLQYGDTALVETRYIPTEASKIIFEYLIYREKDRSLMATGQSTQVFVNKESDILELNAPLFYKAWKEKWHIL